MPTDRDDALRSALKRLPVAVVIVDGSGTLAPFNQPAELFFELESLRGNLLSARPSHPLAVLIRKLLDRDEIVAKERISFSGGRSYTVEPSRRSTKGRGRWLMLLIEPAAAPLSVDPKEQWSLTGREADVAQMLAQGKQSDEICEILGFAPNTLKTHIKALLSKTSSRTRSELVAKLLRADG